MVYGKNSAGEPITFRIARSGGANTEYRRVLDLKTKPYRRQLQNGTVDVAILEDLVLQTFAETVVLGWSGVEDAEGKVLPYSKEAALKLMQDLPELYQDLLEVSQRASTFRQEEREADAKN
ncbi:hypothetical protein [uncultured Rothia sp.]|uniref:hypothetical protein n=1 Tax=uncultured Rothia sp. TaxID=316088 RepID=UPI0025F6356B|nr:hypothetical protein [uncultured Rothia sp.]